MDPYHSYAQKECWPESCVCSHEKHQSSKRQVDESEMRNSSGGWLLGALAPMGRKARNKNRRAGIAIKKALARIDPRVSMARLAPSRKSVCSLWISSGQTALGKSLLSSMVLCTFCCAFFILEDCAGHTSLLACASQKLVVFLARIRFFKGCDLRCQRAVALAVLF